MRICIGTTLRSTKLKGVEVQDSWHSRTVSFEDVLKLSRVGSQMVNTAHED